MTVYFDGYTAKTPLGPVDMVPLLRRLDGDKEAKVHESEKDAAVLALHASGVPLVRIPALLDVSWETAHGVLNGKRRKRGTAEAESKNDRWRALVLKRESERQLIDGRWVHPTCEHGKNSSYVGYGCRCEPCTQAHGLKRREYRARKRAAA